MALQAKAIKSKIKAVGNIKKITKTMEMVAASKMRKAIESALGSRDYALSALEILVHLADERNVEHDMLTERTSGKGLIVIVASNKGLCGGYNVNVSRKVKEYTEHNHDIDYECITIGKQAERIAHRYNVPIIASFTEFSDFANTEDAHQLVAMITDVFMRDETYQHIAIAYTQFIQAMNYAPKVKKLLPIDPDSLYLMVTDTMATEDIADDIRSAKKLYTFEPSEEEVLEAIIPELLTAVIFQVLLDAYASEHSSRMIAMQNATENAGTMQDELTLSYNKARQAGITQEIAEISAGANAMQ